MVNKKIAFRTRVTLAKHMIKRKEMDLEALVNGDYRYLVDSDNNSSSLEAILAKVCDETDEE